MLRVIDTETTNFEGGIVEIASVDIVNGVICNPMSDLVRPPEEIGFAAMAIHHITEDMVADAPLISDVIGRYLGADVYVAHNAAFDKGKLPQIDAPWICTLKLARKLYPELESHGNQYLRYCLGLKPDVPEGLYAHRALYDCYITAALLLDIMHVSGWRPEEMATITGRPALLTTFTFGKYRGKAVAEIAENDPGYLRWLFNNLDRMSPELRLTLKHYLGE